ncbi:ATP-binding protein [Thermodesulfobacteriota bacterium]
MPSESSYLSITVDKSHIITIGERLYEQSIALIRELVNNAYDADATRVDVSLSDKEVLVSDNGMGMDRQGLAQYFSIGSEEKLRNPISPKYGRNRIGQFGIGKFASLAAASRFEVTTRKGDFAALVVFDKARWIEDGQSWQLPLKILPQDSKKEDGTMVRLIDLKRHFKEEDVTQRIAEGVPIRARDFSVYVNGYRVTPRRWIGNRIPVMEGTKYGIVYGEIVILPVSRASKVDMGLEIKVKGVTVRRELFDMTFWGKAATRIRGEINADFLPLTSDRSGFVTDSLKYRSFLKVMEKAMAEVKRAYNQLVSYSDNRKVSRALKEALQRVHQALGSNPEFSPFGVIPIAENGVEGVGETGIKNGPKDEKPEEVTVEEINQEGGEEETTETQQEDTVGSTIDEEQKPKKKKKPSLKIATPNAVVKKLKFGDAGVTCCLDHLGEDGPECMTESTIIYINRDHPLYKRESKKRDAHLLNIARLITQEVSLMKDPGNPREAYNRQSKLLRDAFREEDEKSGSKKNKPWMLWAK